MKLDLKAVTLASALVWGVYVLGVALASALSGGYGGAALEMLATLYPGYEAGSSFLQIAVGTGYALADGALFGLLLGWFYNSFASGDASDE